jgi:predicted transposase YdaD
MQRDPDFYSRIFAETYTYLHQYEKKRPWRGLLMLRSRKQVLGNASHYSDFAVGKVERLYLQDLISRTQLSPTLAILQLIALPAVETSSAAQNLLAMARNQSSEAFRQTLDLVEAILINKFPQLSTEEILAMLDLKNADIRQTRFYQEVFKEGEEDLIRHLFTRRFGPLSKHQQDTIHALSPEQIKALGEAMFDFSEVADLDRWLEKNT